MEHRGSISIPYEISIPKCDISLHTGQDLDDYGPEDQGDPPSRSGPLHDTSRADTAFNSRLCSQRSSFSLQSPDATTATISTSTDFSNDTESGFESGSSSMNTTSSWRSQTYGLPSMDDNLPDLRNVTVRSTWRNRPGALDEAGVVRGKGGPLTPVDFCGGSDDEAGDTPATWKPYRASSILDTEKTGNGRIGAGLSAAAPKGAKPSPAEVRHGNAVCQVHTHAHTYTRTHTHLK